MTITYRPHDPFPKDGFVATEQYPTEDVCPVLKIKVMGEFSARAYVPGDNEVCISITTRNTRGFNVGDVPLHEKFVDVLRLKFDDIAVDSMGSEAPESITPSQAMQVVEFLKKHEDANTLVIHCFAGVSRSRSLAAAIVDHLGLPYSFTVLNHDVYAKVSNALHEGYEK